MSLLDNCSRDGALSGGEREFVSTKPKELDQAEMIAIVDDDEDVRTALSGLLESLGYSARLYESADRFLAAGVVNEVDCIISDVQMPGTDGLQLAERLQTGAPPIILITAFPTASVVGRARAAGARCVLTKPFESDELIDQLRYSLDNRAAA
jgi:FixJ family two-component response regulator